MASLLKTFVRENTNFISETLLERIYECIENAVVYDSKGVTSNPANIYDGDLRPF